MDITKVVEVTYEYESGLTRYTLEDGTEVLADESEQQMIREGENITLDYLPDKLYEPIYHVREESEQDYEVEKFVIRNKKTVLKEGGGINMNKGTYTYWEKQLIAYTKGHYGFVNFSYTVLKYFAASMYDLQVEDVGKYSVNHMLFALHNKMNVSRGLEQTIESMFRRSNGTNISYEYVIHELLTDIQGAKTMGILSDFTVDDSLRVLLTDEHNKLLGGKQQT